MSERIADMARDLTLLSPANAEMMEMARRPLEPGECALIVIDVQERLLTPVFEKERVIKNAQLLLRLATIIDIPILATTQYAKKLGETVPELRSLLPQTEIDKQVFSCFGSEAFCSSLQRLPGRRNTVLLSGIESHICVTQTAIAALRKGYLVHVASDAVSSRTEWNWRIGLERMGAAGAVISSTEMMIYELLRSSGTDAFKQMLAHLR